MTEKGLIARKTEDLTTQFCHPRVLIKLPPVHSPVLDALANNTCVSLLPAGLWHTPNLTENCSSKAHAEGGIRGLDETLCVILWGKQWGKRGRYGSKVNYILGSLHSERRSRKGLAGDHMKVNGTIIYWKSLYCVNKEMDFFLTMT